MSVEAHISEPLYGDDDFKFTKFEQFPIELKVRIFTYLKVLDIVKFKSIIDDETVQGIRVKDIGNKWIRLKFNVSHNDYKDILHEDEHFTHSLVNKLSIFDQISDLANSRDCIVVGIDCKQIGYVPIQFLNRLIGDKQIFELQLHFDTIDYDECKKLESFQHANQITVLNLSCIRYSHDKICLSNLSESRVDKIIYSTDLFNTLHHLVIDERLGEDLLKFNNLKTLNIRLSSHSDFHIKSLPRNILKLVLSSYFGGKVRINSSEDWPMNLKDLTLLGLPTTFNEIQDCELPSTLIKLFVMVKSFYSIIRQIPKSILDVELNIWGKNGVIDDEDFKFPTSLTRLVLISLDLEIKGNRNHFIIPENIIEFQLINCKLPIPLNNFNFENCKSMLEGLAIRRYNTGESYYNLDFSQFPKLRHIIFEDCGIDNLHNFIPPPGLIIISIDKSQIHSIDETMPLFKNPLQFPLLKSISIKNCPIEYFSPTIELPINLEILFIYGSTFDNLDILLPTISHENLKEVHFSRIASMEFKEIPNFKRDKPSNIEIIHIKFTEDFLRVRDNNIDELIRIVELYFGKKVNYSKVELSQTEICGICQHKSWTGCGKHKSQVMDITPKEHWCTCESFDSDVEDDDYPPKAGCGYAKTAKH
ncbi:hypothetical protein DFJ63DRAFT_342226 [Scheffersomyces coipomensis]|uniref:uncharacterized protein n=1 Tax=Scheffersomyces coipomensis TaxID=1788519 RepID=UPI00315CAF74